MDTGLYSNHQPTLITVLQLANSGRHLTEVIATTSDNFPGYFGAELN